MERHSKAEKKAIVTAIVGTVLLMALIVALCVLLGLSYQNPPPDEQGVEVNLGDSDFGLGENPDPQESETETVTPTAPSPVAENVSTQKTETSVAMNTKKEVAPQKVEPKVEPKKEEVKKEPEINKKALFPGKKKSQGGGSEGVTSGEGNQGKAGGNPNSTRYDGNPGNGGSGNGGSGNGTGYSLKGRTASRLTNPTYNSSKEGKVVVKIWVDRNGNVVKAEPGIQGSTTTDARLLEQAKQAAMQSKFSSDPNATEQQVGTITYIFRKNN